VALALVLGVATVVYFQSNPSSDLVAPGQSRGEILFLSKGCTGCHTIEGVAEGGQIGPDLTHVSDVAGERVAGLTAEEYITQSLATPSAFYVPGFGPTVAEMPDLHLSETEIAALVDFLLDDR
jgi:cytochrome c oxidase subunit 2